MLLLLLFFGERAISSFISLDFLFDFDHLQKPVSLYLSLSLSARMKKWFLLCVNINKATWTVFKRCVAREEEEEVAAAVEIKATNSGSNICSNANELEIEREKNVRSMNETTNINTFVNWMLINGFYCVSIWMWCAWAHTHVPVYYGNLERTFMFIANFRALIFY